VELPDTPVAEALRRARQALPLVREDHPLTAEIAAAENIVPFLADL
jgi:histidine ammonia-lyase